MFKFINTSLTLLRYFVALLSGCIYVLSLSYSSRSRKVVFLLVSFFLEMTWSRSFLLYFCLCPFTYISQRPDFRPPGYNHLRHLTSTDSFFILFLLFPAFRSSDSFILSSYYQFTQCCQSSVSSFSLNIYCLFLISFVSFLLTFIF